MNHLRISPQIPPFSAPRFWQAFHAMGSSFKSGLTAQDLNFTVYHVFLPPKLPGRDDITSRNEDFLTGLVFEALSGFRGNVDPSNHSTVDVALTTMKNMRSARDHEGGIHEDSLRKLLQQLPMEGM